MKNFTLTTLMVALTLFTVGKVNAQTVVDLTEYDDPNILVDTLDGLSGGEIVLLKPGMTYNAGGFAFTMSVTIQSSDPLNLNRPKIECNPNFNFGDGATVDSIIFRNLELMSEFDGYNNRYVINSNVAATIGKLMFEGCYIHDLRGVVRMKDVGPGTLDQFVIENSVVTMIRDYGVITVDVDGWMCNHITLLNSTFSKTRGFLTSRNVTTSLLIEGCTFSEVPAAGQRMFRWRTAGQDTITEGIMVKNTLWGTGWDETSSGSTAYDGYDGLGSTAWTFENTYITSDLDIEGDSITGFNYVYANLSTDLWANLAEGNLNYADSAFAGIGNSGDQRWGIATDDGGVEWNISDTVFNALGTLDTTIKVAGLTIFANSGKTVVIDDNNKTVGEMSFTQRLKLGGSGDFDDVGLPAGRVLSIDLMHSSTITVAAMSSSSSSDRVLNIAVGNKDTLIGEFPALGAELTMGEYDYYGGPTTLMLYSPSSGVNVYYIKTADIVNIDANLAGLSVDVGTLSPAFDPAVVAYAVDLPAGTTSVAVTATPNDPNATVTGDGAVDVSSGSATATVTVTAEDGTTTMEYVVEFTVVAPNNDASLSSVTVSVGALDPGFDPGLTTYSVDVPAGTTTVTVSATATDPNATVTGTGDVDVTSGSGTAEIVVTAEDGTTTTTYTINISVLVGIEDAHMKEMLVYPTLSNGIFYVEFAGKPGSIKVYDVTGRMVVKRNAVSSIETIELNEAGIYLFRMESENEIRTVRVISVK